MASHEFERQLPHDPDTEAATLGSILSDNRLIEEAAITIKPSYFHVQSNQIVFLAMLTLYEQRSEITPILIGNILRAEKNLSRVGGVTGITKLMYGLPSVANLKTYTRILREKALAREGMRECAKLYEQFAEEDPAVIAAGAVERFSEIRGQEAVNGGYGGQLSELIPQLKDHLYVLKAGVNPAISTGLSDLDKLTGGGITPGQLWGIGALSSRGKTALLVQMLRTMAKHGEYVALFSLEKRALAIALRILAAETGVPRHKINFGLPEKDIDWLIQELPKHFQQPFYIYTDCRSVIDIKRRIETLNRKLATQGKRLRVAGIDYYGLLSGYGAGRDRYENRTQELKYIAAFLQQQIALDQEVGLIVPAQFNRSGWSAAEPGPGNIDGGEAYFQACDLYATLKSKEIKQGESTANADLVIFKQSDGPRGKLALTFHGPKMEFFKREADEEEEPEKPDLRAAMNELNESDDQKEYL